jgi:16S rRNA C967 or C1407 C5-methylase (RsmB/RsmF family)/NOL1/NOP2/fmu family ribosome biogenesis protein
MSSVIFPPDFEARMQQQPGVEWLAFARAHDETSPVSIRVNLLKDVGSHGITAEATPIPWADTGLYIKERPVFTLDPAFHAGAYYVQEASSMLLEQALKKILPAHSPVRVLDLCAAPGGKSTHLLSLLPLGSLLVSNEVIRSRATILTENLCKWGYSNVIITSNDPTDFKRLQGFFDIIVLDAPCSGEGLFRKDPNSIREWSVENANLCTLRQQRILHDCWPALKEGGMLVYSTCTYNPEENDENVIRFSREKNCELIKLEVDPSWGVHRTEAGLQCYPDKVRGEGFYLSVLQKKEEQSSGRFRGSKNIFTKPQQVTVNYQHWITSEAHLFQQFKDQLLMMPENVLSDMESISSQLNIVSCGTTVGTVKQNKLVPHHSLAMSVHLNNEAFQLIPVSKEEAIAYLRKENVWKDSFSKGYSIIGYEGLPLGFVNVLDNRMNNLYPSEWRIRMAPV